MDLDFGLSSDPSPSHFGHACIAFWNSSIVISRSVGRHLTLHVSSHLVSVCGF